MPYFLMSIGMRGVELRNKDIFSAVQPINSSISDDPEEGVRALFVVAPGWWRAQYDNESS
jgi:hypothetical protein